MFIGPEQNQKCLYAMVAEESLDVAVAFWGEGAETLIHPEDGSHCVSSVTSEVVEPTPPSSIDWSLLQVGWLTLRSDSATDYTRKWVLARVMPYWFGERFGL